MADSDDGYGDEGSYEETTLPAGTTVNAQAPADMSTLVEKGHIKSEQVVNVQTR